MTDGDYGDCDSGPFCQHWHDPRDCDEQCADCGHACRCHGFSGPACEGDGKVECDCPGFIGDGEISSDHATAEAERKLRRAAALEST